MSRHLGPEDKALEFFTTRQDPRTYSTSAEDEKHLRLQLDIFSSCNDVVRQSRMLVQSGTLQLFITETSFLIVHQTLKAELRDGFRDPYPIILKVFNIKE